MTISNMTISIIILIMTTIKMALAMTIILMTMILMPLTTLMPPTWRSLAAW